MLRGRGWGEGGGGKIRCVLLLTTCLLVQLGESFMVSEQKTPVAVAGLSSGVAMVALGAVRLFCDCCAADACVRAAMCVFD